MKIATIKIEENDSMILPTIRKDFWEFLISRHPIEGNYARSTRNAYRWRPLPTLRLVIVQFVRKGDVGVFVRGERGANPNDVEAKLNPYAAKLKKALGVNELYCKGQFYRVDRQLLPTQKYFFQKCKNFESSRRSCWGIMADWLHSEADSYQDALSKVMGASSSPGLRRIKKY